MLKSTPGKKKGGEKGFWGAFGGPQGGIGEVRGGVSSPLMGAPKTVATPTACAATSISFCLNLFCRDGVQP